jgi:4a-hydroxytetrahydrobiopterin dehydratase
MTRPRPLTAAEFESEAGVADWMVRDGSVVAEFTVRPYAAAASLIAAIGEAADAADHHPEVWLRYPGVVRVEFTTHSIGNGISSLDVELARTVSQLARDHGAVAG